jgi:hypothetical protein
MRLITAFILMLIPVITYYAWALHVSNAYPPYHVAAKDNWVWDAGFGSWLRARYFLPELFDTAEWLWGAPLLASALAGFLLPPAPGGKSNLRRLFHWWFWGGAVFYAFGAQELVRNPWNLHAVDPALAGLGGEGLLMAGAVLARLHLPLIGRTAAIAVIVVTHGFEMRHLRWMYRAYASQSYELGRSLARTSSPSDLVVTVANSIGDPVAIYYSQRRGWVFPPAWSGVHWAADVVNEPAAIQLFDRLRSDGAKWFGIVAEQRKKFRETVPQLLAHIEGTTELVDEDRDWAIYRIPPPPK